MSRPLMQRDSNIVLLDMHRGPDISEVRFAIGGCTETYAPGVIHLARTFAKQAVKEDLKGRGINPAYIDARTITLLADQLLRSGRWNEFREKAQRVIDRVEKAKVLSAAQRKQRSNSTTIPVQKSGAK